MNKRREIDERDIDKLLAALSDLQIAELHGMTEKEVSKLRQTRKRNSSSANSDETTRK